MNAKLGTYKVEVHVFWDILKKFLRISTSTVFNQGKRELVVSFDFSEKIVFDLTNGDVNSHKIRNPCVFEFIQISPLSTPYVKNWNSSC